MKDKNDHTFIAGSLLVNEDNPDTCAIKCKGVSHGTGTFAFVSPTGLDGEWQEDSHKDEFRLTQGAILSSRWVAPLGLPEKQSSD